MCCRSLGWRLASTCGSTYEDLCSKPFEAKQDAIYPWTLLGMDGCTFVFCAPAVRTAFPDGSTWTPAACKIVALSAPCGSKYPEVLVCLSSKFRLLAASGMPNI